MMNINAEIAALRRLKSIVTPDSFFPGDSNLAAIDAQIKVLEGRAKPFLYGDNWHVYTHAEYAQFWLEGKTDIAPSQQWAQGVET